jgi:N-acetylglucosaminyldiphosphoundecaprenol N-acetyl-beta-D-mannosaminyltransferase
VDAKIGMEWFWRLASEPRRLWQRYTTQGSKYIGILLRERRDSKQRSDASPEQASQKKDRAS